MIGRKTSCDRGPGAVRQLIELVQAQVVRAPLHVGRGERDAERVAQRGNVLEVDLFLQVLGAGGDQHALAAENRGHEVGERLAGAGAGLGEEDAAVLEHARHGGRHLDLAGARLEVGHRAGERPAGREDRGDAPRLVVPAYASGYSGNFRHSLSTSARTMPSARSSSGVCSARANSSPMSVHLGFAHAARGHRRRADADAARDHRRILIERNRVLVDGDAGLAERRLGHLAGDALREDVDEHQVVVGAAADEAEARRRSARSRAVCALATICRW